METKEELMAKLKAIEEQEKEEPSKPKEINQVLVELELKIFLRTLKDKQEQVESSRFKRPNIVELDSTRRDGLKTLNTIRNEIDELNFNINARKAILPKEVVEAIEKQIKDEKWAL